MVSEVQLGAPELLRESLAAFPTLAPAASCFTIGTTWSA